MLLRGWGLGVLEDGEAFLRYHDARGTAMSMTIQSDLEVRLRGRAEAEGVSVEAYLERVARDDEQAERELERLALEGLYSGDAIVGDDAFWDARIQRVRDRAASPR
jgi:hypothetical protein